MEKFSFGNFTGEAEQGFMCWHRPAHGNHPCWPWKMNFPIFFKMVQNNVTWHLIRKLWRHITGPILPKLVHLKNRPESEYITWSQASDNMLILGLKREKTKRQNSQPSFQLPLCRHQPTHSILFVDLYFRGSRDKWSQQNQHHLPITQDWSFLSFS